jgi:hypothetical protein
MFCDAGIYRGVLLKNLSGGGVAVCFAFWMY